MKKKEYLEKLDSLGFDKKDYCIISGGVMMMYGLREETEDIDLKITDELYLELANQNLLKKSPKMENLYEYGEFTELKVGGFTRENIHFIDGYPVESLEEQLRWKKENHRKKDEYDISLIEEYLKKH